MTKQLSQDFNLLNPREKSLLVESGKARIVIQGRKENHFDQEVFVNEDTRLGMLPVTRIFGMPTAKPLVTAEPEITLHEVTDSDDFLILASASLWLALSNQEAIDIVKSSLETNPDDVSLAANNLVEAAYAKEDYDDLSAIIIKLKP